MTSLFLWHPGEASWTTLPRVKLLPLVSVKILKKIKEIAYFCFTLPVYSLFFFKLKVCWIFLPPRQFRLFLSIATSMKYQRVEIYSGDHAKGHHRGTSSKIHCSEVSWQPTKVKTSALVTTATTSAESSVFVFILIHAFHFEGKIKCKVFVTLYKQTQGLVGCSTFQAEKHCLYTSAPQCLVFE